MIPGEQEIDSIRKAGIILTTHKIRQVVNANGLYLKSIMLDQVTSCKVVYSDPKGLYIAAALILIISVFVGIKVNTWGYFGSIASIILLIIYFFTRGGYITVHAVRDEIRTIKINTGASQMISFIDKIENAKNQRYYSRGSATTDIRNWS